MTRPYVEGPRSAQCPHLLVVGRSFHNRGEIETLRAALAAIEWPDVSCRVCVVEGRVVSRWR